MINEVCHAVLDGIVENLPTALIMAGAAAVWAAIAHKKSRRDNKNRNDQNSSKDGRPMT